MQLDSLFMYSQRVSIAVVNTRTTNSQTLIELIIISLFVIFFYLLGSTETSLDVFITTRFIILSEERVYLHCSH